MLSELSGVDKKLRAAQFRTVISFFSAKKELWVDGRIEGFITEKPIGEKGFGYDSVFFVPDRDFTVAQMGREETNKLINIKIKSSLKSGVKVIFCNGETLKEKRKKNLEFEYATSGTVGLEAMFGILSTLFPMEKVISILTKGKDIFGVKNQTIEVGQEANLTLFNPNGSAIFKETDLISTSKNCAFINSPIEGTVYGIINNSQLTLK